MQYDIKKLKATVKPLTTYSKEQRNYKKCEWDSSLVVRVMNKVCIDSSVICINEKVKSCKVKLVRNL